MAISKAVANHSSSWYPLAFFIDNLLVRIHFIIEMIRWTGLAPWECEFPFPGSLICTFIPAGAHGNQQGRGQPQLLVVPVGAGRHRLVHPRPETLNPQPSTLILNPQPLTLNPDPQS